MMAVICFFRESELLVAVIHEPTLSALNLQLWLEQMKWLAMKLFAKFGPSSRKRICM
jgi:hypothetical protein